MQHPDAREGPRVRSPGPLQHQVRRGGGDDVGEPDTNPHVGVTLHASGSGRRWAPGRYHDGVSEPASITVRRRIEWADTDASGKYHNTAVFRLAEQAETRLLDRLGLLEEVYGRLPRVHMSVDLTEPLRFNDPVDVTLRVADVGRTSITYEFEVRRGERAVARGKMVAVLLEAPGEREEWSEEHRRILTTAGPQAAAEAER